MSKERGQLRYCRRRPQPNCKIKTYSKDVVCSGCKGDLQVLSEDLAYIKELGIVPDPRNMQDDTDL